MPSFPELKLDVHVQHRLFDEHMNNLQGKISKTLDSVFDDLTPRLNSTFEDVLPGLQRSETITKLKLAQQVEVLRSHWRTYDARRRATAEHEFKDMLAQNSYVDFWGRMQKQLYADDSGKTIIAQDVDKDSGVGELDGGIADLSAMASQIDLQKIHEWVSHKIYIHILNAFFSAEHSVLKTDRRYLVWDMEPELRNRWIEVHQIHWLYKSLIQLFSRNTFKVSKPAKLRFTFRTSIRSIDYIEAFTRKSKVHFCI